jgi:DNA invertase Pin-like site-specific DNA recombinase
VNVLKQNRAGLYVRVSTNDQSTDAQESELRDYAQRRGWLVHGVYRDKGISGAKPQRPALTQLFADCRKRAVDVVVVWKFDRFARSLKQLVGALEEFRALGIDFVSCTEAVDTSIPTGELVFQIFGAIAQFERSLIAERVKAGIAQAKREGRRVGRKPLREFTQAEIRNVVAAHAGGRKSVRATAREFQTTAFMVKKILGAQHAAK